MNSAVDRRRELNRLAAQKLRNRQKEKAVNVKQDYFAAQSRNTQLLYDVKQLRKLKVELSEKYAQHVPICHLSTAKDRLTAQNVSFRLAPDTVPNQQQYISPVYLLSSDGGSVLPSGPIQLVTITPSEDGIIDCQESNLVSTDIEMKTEPEFSTADSQLSNGTTSLDSNDVRKTLNGMSIASSFNSDRVSDVLLAAVDVHRSRSMQATDSDNKVSGVSSVPASPVNKPVHRACRRRSLSSLSLIGEPAPKATKRLSFRAVSSDKEPINKRAAEDDVNLPLCVSGLSSDID